MARFKGDSVVFTEGTQDRRITRARVVIQILTNEVDVITLANASTVRFIAIHLFPTVSPGSTVLVLTTGVQPSLSGSAHVGGFSWTYRLVMGSRV